MPLFIMTEASRVEGDTVKYFYPSPDYIVSIRTPILACLYILLLFLYLPSPFTSFSFAYYFSA